MPEYNGRLITFHSDPYLCIPFFISGDQHRCVLWLGGQCDGFFVNTFMPSLSEKLQNIGWSLGQLMSSSSFIGHGGHDHVHDAEDLDTLITLLINEHQMTEVTLFASSTGVQIALEFLENCEHADVVTRVILQGVVCSPKNLLFSTKEREKRLQKATALVQAGRTEELQEMRNYYDIPVTASRVAGGGCLTLMEAFWLPWQQDDISSMIKNISCIRVPLLLMIAFGTDYIISMNERVDFQNKVKHAAGCVDVTVKYFVDMADEQRRMLKASESPNTDAIISFLINQDDQRDIREKQEAIKKCEEGRRKQSIIAKNTLVLQY